MALEPENEVAKALETLGASAQAIDAVVKKSEENIKEAEGKKIAPVSRLQRKRQRKSHQNRPKHHLHHPPLRRKRCLKIP